MDNKILFSVCVIVLAFFVPGSLGKGKLSCNNGLEGPSAETMGLIASKCKDPAIWGMEAGKKNPDCDQLCVAEVLGYLAPDNTISMDMYNKWIESDFAPQNQEFAKKHIMDCYEKYGSKIDYNDKACVEMKKFDTCGWSMVPNLKC